MANHEERRLSNLQDFQQELDAMTHSDEVERVLDLAKQQLLETRRTTTTPETKHTGTLHDEPTPVKTPSTTKRKSNELERLQRLVRQQSARIRSLEVENKDLRRQLLEQQKPQRLEEDTVQLLEELQLQHLPPEHRASLVRILSKYV